jgi:hypothetical protein
MRVAREFARTASVSPTLKATARSFAKTATGSPRIGRRSASGLLKLVEDQTGTVKAPPDIFIFQTGVGTRALSLQQIRLG